MIVETSALVAILRPEPEEMAFLRALMADGEVKLSAASYFEFGMVIDQLKDEGASAAVDRLLVQIEAEIFPVTKGQAELAREAYRRFGKGHHPARLNFGDCFAYGLSKQTGEPLLFKGEDFARTDVARAL